MKYAKTSTFEQSSIEELIIETDDVIGIAKDILSKTSGDSQKNPNETKSTIIAFIMSIVFAFVTFFLISESVKVVFIKLFVVTLVLLATRFYLYLTRIKLYYKEK